MLGYSVGVLCVKMLKTEDKVKSNILDYDLEMLFSFFYGRQELDKNQTYTEIVFFIMKSRI